MKKIEANAIPGHNIPLAIVGCFILAFGWFGFNAGSSLAGGDLRISVVAVNTMMHLQQEHSLQCYICGGLRQRSQTQQ